MLILQNWHSSGCEMLWMSMNLRCKTDECHDGESSMWYNLPKSEVGRQKHWVENI